MSKKCPTWRKALECTLPIKPDPIIATFNFVLDIGIFLRGLSAPASLPFAAATSRRSLGYRRFRQRVVALHDRRRDGRESLKRLTQRDGPMIEPACSFLSNVGVRQTVGLIAERVF